MRVLLFSTAVLLVTLIAASDSALACDCMILPEPERTNRAEVVFEGEVVSILYSKEHPKLPSGYKFQVTRILKGEPVTEITILRTGSNCDDEFTPGSAYRVYARQQEGKLTTSICAGNKHLSRRTKKRSLPGLTPQLRRFLIDAQQIAS